MFGVYTSLAALYREEMRILFWLGAASVALTAGYGAWMYRWFRRRRRTVRWAGTHLSLAAGSWFVWAFSWYFWLKGGAYWQGRVAEWHYIAFVVGGGGVALATALGLAVHHVPPRPRWTGRMAVGHLSAALAGALLWLSGMWPFR